MNKSERFWDRTAENYDREESGARQTFNRIIDKTKRYLKQSDRLLDYGCGTGSASLELAGGVKEVQAIDISSKMVEIAKAKTVERGISNIAYSHSTIFDESYVKGSFDVILGFHILHLVDDTGITLQRIVELVRPGGLFISTTPLLGGRRRGVAFLLSLLGKIGLVPPIKVLKKSDFEEELTNRGFEIVESECLSSTTQEWFIAAKRIK